MSEFRKRILVPLAYPLTAAFVVAVLVISLSRILLATPEKWSTTIALLVAAEVLGVASVIAAGTRMRVAQKGLLLLVGFALMAGGGVGASLGVRKIEQQGLSVAIAAKDVKFVETSVKFPADQEVTVKFLNNDAGVPHNINVTSDAAGGTSVAKGAVFSGIASQSFRVPPLKEGKYFFHCDVHPTLMKGELDVAGAAPPVAEAGAAAPAPPPSAPAPTASESEMAMGDSADVVAKGLAFTTKSLKLKANATDTLHFQNDDASVMHNVDITKDQAGANTVYKTDLVTGVAHQEFQFHAPPAGKYFFHCDVHPQMTGTITFE